MNSGHATSHELLCKCIDGGHIGGVDQKDGEFMDAVHFGRHIITLIFTNRLDQYLRDCSAAIDRIERRKDTNMLWESGGSMQERLEGIIEHRATL